MYDIVYVTEVVYESAKLEYILATILLTVSICYILHCRAVVRLKREFAAQKNQSETRLCNSWSWMGKALKSYERLVTSLLKKIDIQDEHIVDLKLLMASVRGDGARGTRGFRRRDQP